MPQVIFVDFTKPKRKRKAWKMPRLHMSSIHKGAAIGAAIIGTALLIIAGYPLWEIVCGGALGLVLMSHMNK